MGVDDVCRPKAGVVGCAVDVSSDVGCTECVAGYRVADRVCVPCNATHAMCAACDEAACTACNPDHVLRGGNCTHVAAVADCVAAADSRCTRCAFWRRPTQAGDGCEAHAVWWVVILAVLGALIAVVVDVAATVAAVVAAVGGRRSAASGSSALKVWTTVARRDSVAVGKARSEK